MSDRIQLSEGVCVLSYSCCCPVASLLPVRAIVTGYRGSSASTIQPNCQPAGQLLVDSCCANYCYQFTIHLRHPGGGPKYSPTSQSRLARMIDPILQSHTVTPFRCCNCSFGRSFSHFLPIHSWLLLLDSMIFCSLLLRTLHSFNIRIASSRHERFMLSPRILLCTMHIPALVKDRHETQ
jgi:hypothetical protein